MEPAIDWFANVLANDIGHHEWVPMNDEEMEAYKKTLPASMRHDPYPNKVITHSIPPGDSIILEQGKYVIACNNERAREMLFGLAKRYKELQHDASVRARTTYDEVWKPASEWPDNQLSACRNRTVIVDSGILHFIGGVHTGYHDYSSDKWYLYAGGKAIEHPVEFWRHIPIGPSLSPEYKDVEKEVEALRDAFNSQPANFHCFAHSLLMEVWRGKEWKKSQKLRDAMQDLAEAINSVQPNSFPDSFDDLVKNA